MWDTSELLVNTLENMLLEHGQHIKLDWDHAEVTVIPDAVQVQEILNCESEALFEWLEYLFLELRETAQVVYEARGTAWD